MQTLLSNWFINLKINKKENTKIVVKIRKLTSRKDKESYQKIKKKEQYWNDIQTMKEFQL